MSKNNTLERESEIKAYIYQQVSELEDFLTKDTKIEVIERNSSKVIKKLIKREELESGFKANFCYEISIEEEGSRLNSYGLADDEFEAIKIAKDKMLNHLIMIQNEAISTSDHLNEINDVISGNNILH